jgi:hypothetical protein
MWVRSGQAAFAAVLGVVMSGCSLALMASVVACGRTDQRRLTGLTIGC